MAQVHPPTDQFSRVKSKVVVISGGSTGIGAATVTLLVQHGASVVFGDTNALAATELVSQLGEDKVTFVPCDVTKHADIYRLFKTAHEKHGRIDHAVSNAGIFETGNWFSSDLSIANIADDEGDLATINVNIIGSMRFSRVAIVFMRENPGPNDHNTTGDSTGDRSLTMLSSVNAFRESPGLFAYQTSKHAIHGFMRASRKPLWEKAGVRVNAVCPGVTDTPMVGDIAERFRAAGLFTQPPDAVARFIVTCIVTTSMRGKGIYIEGGDGWEFEDSFYAQQPVWLGEEPTRRMRVNADAVNKGALTKN